MTTLRTNEAITSQLDAGKVLNVSGSALVVLTSKSGAVTKRGVSVATSFGPFAQDQVYQVTRTSGAVEVSESFSDQGALATLATDPNGSVTGLVGPEGKTFSLKKRFRRIQSRALTGRCKALALTDGTFTAFAPNANTNGLTLYNRIALATDADAVRILIPNMHTSTVAGVKVGLGLTTSAGTWSGSPPAGSGAAGQTTVKPTRTEVVNTSAGDLLVATFNAASSVTLPAAIDATNLVPSYTATDWMLISTVARTDTVGAFPLVDVAIEYPAGVTATLAYNGSGYTAWSAWGNESLTLTDGRIWRAWAQDVLGVTTPANFTQTNVSTYICPVIVQYRSRTTGAVTVLNLGDSVWDGTGATQQNDSFVKRSVHALHTTANPIELCNLSVPGASNFMNCERAAYVVPLVNPAVFSFQWGSINQVSGATMSARQYQHGYGAFGAMMSIASANDCVPLTGSFLPVTIGAKNLGATDSLRVTMNAEIKRQAALDPSEVVYVDFGPAYDGITTGGQVEPIVALVVASDVHPSDAGHAALDASAFRAGLALALNQKG